MASFIGRHPVSVAFDSASPCCYVTLEVAHLLGHSAPLAGSCFSDILTASYHGRVLTTDVEFEIASVLDSDVLVGMNWIAAWRTVGREDMNPVHNPYSSSVSDPEVTTCILSGDAKHIDDADTHDLVKSQSSSLVGAVSSSHRRSESIVHNIFFGLSHSGVSIGPFSSDVSLLNQACAFHGLEPKKSHELEERCNLLLQHLLHGECVTSDIRSAHRDYTACREVAAGFSSSSDLVDYILDDLTSYNTPALPGVNLWLVAQSICGDLVCGSGQENHYRRKAIGILNIFRNRGVYEAVSKSSQSLFTKAEYMSKPCLEAVASWHGLCFVGTKDQLLDRIINHMSKGMSETESFDSRTELQIQLLKSCCAIPYEAAATLSQLRKLLRAHVTSLSKGKKIKPIVPLNNRNMIYGQAIMIAYIHNGLS
ncbi:uncharacterized protein EDB91DRAFT_1084142 [Suillus paluster]|uniref:uncharacterized protein n=1 Tax=Suillus paluster TaxID=48578 RepID=UPI001B875B29|nr:uncharacterized protein EDB91DRAFT_1084142 [Suillus paluster]KAG1734236.1 hypothetical protein EDB91DRAFT_1084142 [Suillus paluster]